MVTDSLPTTAASSFETSHPRLPQAVVPLSIQGPAGRVNDARPDRSQARQPHRRAATDIVDSIVEISPLDIVRRRTTSWPGMAAEIVQATRHDRIESRFRLPAPLL